MSPNTVSILLLTTDTLHHAFFVKSIVQRYCNTKIILETRSITPQYETRHSFEQERVIFENMRWFEGNNCKITDLCESWQIEDLNSKRAINHIQQQNPDVVLMFGCGKVSLLTIDACGKNFLNFHGGDPEFYRGLDSHLWAIWHEDFDNLISCVHSVDPNLDTGDIVLKKRFPISHKTTLKEIRALNTEMCIEMIFKILSNFSSGKEIQGIKQNRTGRYYSHMPSCLKEQCIKKLEKHTNKIVDLE